MLLTVRGELREDDLLHITVNGETEDCAYREPVSFEVPNNAPVTVFFEQAEKTYVKPLLSFFMWIFLAVIFCIVFVLLAFISEGTGDGSMVQLFTAWTGKVRPFRCKGSFTVPAGNEDREVVIRINDARYKEKKGTWTAPSVKLSEDIPCECEFSERFDDIHRECGEGLRQCFGFCFSLFIGSFVLYRRSGNRASLILGICGMAITAAVFVIYSAISKRNEKRMLAALENLIV